MDFGVCRRPARSPPDTHHQRARELRDEYSWQFSPVVGRNNLGDVEFLAPGPDGVPGMLRQSLWFDKTSIRSGAGPERLPYTVYDLPLDPVGDEEG